MVITTFEQFRYLPKNKGKDSKTVYKEWLFEEAKLLIMYDSIQVMFQIQNNGVFGPTGAGAGGSTPIPPIPSISVTYYTPDGSDGVTLGYYVPDLDVVNGSYYVYVP